MLKKYLLLLLVSLFFNSFAYPASNSSGNNDGKPLAVNNFPRDAEMIPFPKDDVTPPVTNMYFTGDLLTGYSSFCFCKNTICN